MPRALLIVDTTPTFCEGGRLPVVGGNDCAAAIAAHVDAAGDSYDLVVASEDWHIDPGDHWADAPDFVVSFPRHGVAGTAEASLHPFVAAALERLVARGRRWLLVRKGMHDAAFSVFEGVVVDDPSVLDPTGPGLAEVLERAAIDAIDVCGIATDYCDRETALDALSEGFTVRVLADLCVGVAPDSSATALELLRAAGATIV